MQFDKNSSDNVFSSSVGNLSPTSRQIFSVLLHQSKPISAKEIARRLNISPRAVQYHIKNELLHLTLLLDINLISKPNYGFFISQSDAIKKMVLSKTSDITKHSRLISIGERRALITLYLLFKENPINILQLIAEFNQSRATVFNDLKIIREKLLKKKISLIWQRTEGYSVKGDEITIREFIIETLLTVYDVNELLDLCKNLSNIKSDFNLLNSDVKYQYFYLKGYPLRFYWDQLGFFENTFKIFFTDLSRIELVLYTALMVDRKLKDCELINFERSIEIYDSEEFKISNTLVNKLKEKHQILFNKAEIDYLAIKLLCMNRNSFFHGARAILPDSELFNTKLLTKEIVYLASQYLHPHLQVDSELLIGLTDHLDIMINKILNGQIIINKHLGKIKANYQYIYQISSICARHLENKTNLKFPEDEIGNLAMHFAAALERINYSPIAEKRVIIACDEDTSEQIFLVSKLNTAFPQLKIQNNLAVSKISKKIANPDVVDFVISTVPINYLEVPVVTVSPLLDEQDKNAINTHVFPEKYKLDNNLDFELKNLLSLRNVLLEDQIRLGIVANSWKIAVEEACVPLVKKNIIESRYVTSIIEGLRINGPYMVIWQNIALLHARPIDGAKVFGISYTRFQNPVIFGHDKNDPVHICIALSSIDATSHFRILYELNQLFTNKEISHQLMRLEDKTSLINLIRIQCAEFEQNDFDKD